MWVYKDLDPIVFRKTFLHNLFDILAWDMRRIEITILAQKMLPKSLDKLGQTNKMCNSTKLFTKKKKIPHCGSQWLFVVQIRNGRRVADSTTAERKCPLGYTWVHSGRENNYEIACIILWGSK